MEVRYIGQTTKPRHRFKTHIIGSKWSKDPSGKWIRKLLRNGLFPKMLIFESGKVKDILKREIFWIAYHREKGTRILNITGGGEGTLGHSVPDKTRKILSRKARQNWAQKTPEQRDRHRNGGRSLTDEEGRCRKIGEFSRTRKMPERAKKQISSTLFGHVVTQDTRNKLRTSSRRKDSSSKYLGVRFRSATGKWQALVNTGTNKNFYIGQFPTEAEAAVAYDSKVVELGLSYPLNFPPK